MKLKTYDKKGKENKWKAPLSFILVIIGIIFPYAGLLFVPIGVVIAINAIIVRKKENVQHINFAKIALILGGCAIFLIILSTLITILGSNYINGTIVN